MSRPSLGFLREFDGPWREQLLDDMARQLEFSQALRAVDHMPDGPHRARATVEYQVKAWEADGVWVVRDEEGLPGIVARPFPPQTNMMLTAGKYADVLRWIKTLDLDTQREYAWVMLSGILHPSGVEAHNLDGTSEIDGEGLKQHLLSSSEDHRTPIRELIEIAQAQIM